MMDHRSRENLRLKDEIDKLQKQLIYEQSKATVKSPIAHSVSGRLMFSHPID